MKSHRSSNKQQLNSFAIQWLEALNNSEQKEIQMAARQHRLSVCAATCNLDLSQKLSLNDIGMLYPTTQNKSYWRHPPPLHTDATRAPDRPVNRSH